MTLKVQCPACGKDVEWLPEQSWRPFCSERCRLIDLGQWANEEHRISGEPATETEENAAPPPH